MRLSPVLALWSVVVTGCGSNSPPDQQPASDGEPKWGILGKEFTPIPAPSDVAAAPADATVTESGLAYKVLKQGTGTESPHLESIVIVDYVGWTAEGRYFDSSASRDDLSTLEMGSLIPGWIEGLQLMVVGQKVRLWIPESLAFPSGQGYPTGPVVFDLELVQVLEPPAPIPPPPDVAAPPDDAVYTISGLAYKVLTQGTGTEHPVVDSRVEVHYTMWGADGTMLHTSTRGDKPSVIMMQRAIKGWNEGLQLMVVGEKTRFWIPAELGFTLSEEMPRSMVVSDIELFAIAAAPEEDLVKTPISPYR